MIPSHIPALPLGIIVYSWHLWDVTCKKISRLPQTSSVYQSPLWSVANWVVKYLDESECGKPFFHLNRTSVSFQRTQTTTLLFLSFILIFFMLAAGSHSIAQAGLNSLWSSVSLHLSSPPSSLHLADAGVTGMHIAGDETHPQHCHLSAQMPPKHPPQSHTPGLHFLCLNAFDHRATFLAFSYTWQSRKRKVESVFLSHVSVSTCQSYWVGAHNVSNMKYISSKIKKCL